MNKLCVQDLDIRGKRVLIRVDFNVPLKDGKITDDTRIQEALPTIQYILKEGGKVILMSHLGRPKGKEKKLSLEVVKHRLSELLGIDVAFADLETASQVKDFRVLLLENLRFYPEEEDPTPTFVNQLASLGDLYVNDAFGTAHRKHASTYDLAKCFPGKAAAGYLMQKEVAFLENLIKEPKKPFYAIIGGAKVSSKLGVLKSLLGKVDVFFIGGGMAYTFLKAQGLEIGDSLFEKESLEEAKNLLNSKTKIHLPIDFVIAKEFKESAEPKIVQSIPKGWQSLDIGPKTLEIWKIAVQDASTVFWNGPLGVFEFPAFAKGTNEIAKIISTLSAVTVVGGGDSVAAVNALGISNKFSHISTGGGASLEFLEFGNLPGINALTLK